MNVPPQELARLAALLPDVPCFLETRDMLLGGYAEVFGFEEGDEGPSFVAHDGEEGLVCVVGYPRLSAISEAVARDGDAGAVIAMPENVSLLAQALPGREAQPAALHQLGENERLPEVPEGGVVRLLSGMGELRGLPPGLRTELRAELERAFGRGAPVAATFDGGLPVSFCYAAAQTEGLWDVSIDTLDGYRRRGYAAWCAAYMIRHMRERGKEPVWGALESNAASMGLAARLGFVPVDRFFVFEPAREGSAPTL